MKKLFLATIATLTLLTGCYQASNTEGLIRGQKLDADEFVNASKVTKQQRDVVWLENGGIYASPEFEERDLVGKKLIFTGTRNIIYQDSFEKISNLKYKGHEVRSIINMGRGMRMKIITPLFSETFGLVSFMLIQDENSIEMVRANIYQMVEKN